MFTTRSKILVMTVLLSALPFIGFAQTAGEQLVQDYVRLLNAWLGDPFTDKQNQFCAIFLKESGIKDEIVQKFNSEDVFVAVPPIKYLSIFTERNKQQRIKVELIGKPIVDIQRNEVVAKIKFSGGISLVTISNFWIKNKKIEGIVMNDREKTLMVQNHTENAPLEPHQQVAVQDNQPSKPKDNPSQNQQPKKNNSNNTTPSKPQTVQYRFTSSPSYTRIYIDGHYAGSTPLTESLVPGTHTIKAESWRCKDYQKQMTLTPYNTDIHIRLKQLLNRKFEFYIEGNYRTMALPSAGATIGGYLGNFNIEASYYLPLDKSEDIYWCNDIDMPYKTVYTPDVAASAKIGWGIPVGTRLRITPQAGANYCSLKEDNDGNKEDKTFANQANVINIIGSVRFSFAVVKHLGISVTPEYLYMFKTSEGYEVLKEVSPKIQDWTDGFNLKLGLVLFF